CSRGCHTRPSPPARRSDPGKATMTNTSPGSRMWRALPAALLAGAIALTGCSTSADGTDGGTVENPLPPAEDTTQYPLTLDTWAGETTLDERPERIAVIGLQPHPRRARGSGRDTRVRADGGAVVVARPGVGLRHRARGHRHAQGRHQLRGDRRVGPRPHRGDRLHQ